VDALSAAATLALAALISSVVPLVGAVRASDGSALWFAPGALWFGLLPAVVVAALSLRRPVAALAVAAGAGVIGAARFLADLPVLTAPHALARPDLFVETTDRALPLHAAPGGYLLLATDLITLAAGVFAAIRVSGLVSFQRSDPDVSDPSVIPVTGPSNTSVTDPSVTSVTGTSGTPGTDTPATGSSGPDPSGPHRPRAGDVAAAGQDDSREAPFAVFDGPPPGRTTARRNYLLTTVGFVAVLLLAWGALSVPYQGGYLADRFVEAGVPLAGLVGVVVLVALAAAAVLAAGTVPRALAVGLLAGVAVGACLPSLGALVTVLTAPVHLSGAVAIGLFGGLLLLVAGLLTRVGWQHADTEVAPAAPSRAVTMAAGGFALAAGGLALAAAFLAPVNLGGLQDLLSLDGAATAPATPAFGGAAAWLIVTGALTLLPATARAGRAALLVVWATPIPPLVLALDMLDDRTIAIARSLDLVSVGSGTWCGIAALIAAGIAAVLAAVAASRASAAEVTVPDDESRAAARAVTGPVALGVGVLAVVAAALPVYVTAGGVPGPTILHGYTVQSWAPWALLLVTLGALAGAAVTWHRPVALALGVAAVAAQGMRLLLAAAMRDATGFALRPGAVLQAILVLALLAATVVLAARAGRVRTIGVGDLEQVAGQGRAVARTRAGGASSGRAAPTRPSQARSTTAARRRTPQNRRKRR
jgi:hypothetical protein